MKPLKSIHDPKGHEVVVPLELDCFHAGATHSMVSNVVAYPKYMIEVQKSELYFVKQVDWNLNLLVKAMAVEHYYVVQELIENPSVETVSALLSRGPLTIY